MRGTTHRLTTACFALVVGALLAGLAGCVDEEVIFRERPIAEAVPDAANGFLGYSDASAKLTACGNCHQGMQSGWETTGHADAWAGLQESGHAEEFCEGCHTVNELGNPTEAEGGWVATGDERYHDVQCEACHGPGSTHIEDPDASKPFASILAGTDLEAGCGECHQGAHHPFVEQWAASAHGNVTGFAAGRDGCNTCHDGETAISATFNESSDWIEKDDGEYTDIVCATCHDPHGSDHAANLRAPIDEPSKNNLCVRCHSREGTPSQTDDNVHGPHAFQGLLVLGIDVGWIPPGSDLEEAGKIVSSHGTGGNPRLCATCHLSMFEVTDAETGEFLVQSVGHSFEPIPCPLNESGVPAEDCALSERNFSSCATSTCHNDSPDAARSAFFTVRNRINGDLDDLWEDTNGNSVLETADAGLLPQVLAQDLAAGDTDGDGNPVEEINPFDTKFTVAEGALWNAQLAFTHQRPHWGDGSVEGDGRHFGSHKGSGEGVHNPFLLELLLNASKTAVMDEYSVSAAGVSTEIEGQRPPGVTIR